jgi:hypothetical protein
VIVRIAAIARSKPDRFAIAVLAALPLLVFAPALLPGRVLSPADYLFASAPWSAVAPGTPEPNIALADVTEVFHPWALYTWREVRAGRVPLWNPYAYAGVPFVSNPQTALFFPLTWLGWLLPPALALTVPQILKLMVAGPAMYWFLRTLAVTPVPAFIGGAGFMLSSTLVAWLPWTYSTTMVFLPLLFGLIERLAQAPGARTAALLALALAGDALCGYPPSALHGLLAAGVWTIVRAPWRAAPLGYFVAAAASALLAGALAAVQALPALDYVRESAVYFYRGQWTPPLAAPPRSAITFLMPYFFGTGAQTWSPWHFGITSTYVGLVLLFGLPLAGLRWRRSPTMPLAAMAAVVAAVHFGAPAVDVLANAPGMALVNKLRLMPLLVFPLCALGALGLDAALHDALDARRRTLVAVRTSFVVFALVALGAIVLAARAPAADAVRPSLAAQYVLALLGLTVAVVLLARWLAGGGARWGVAVAAVQVATLIPVAATYLPVRDERWLYPTPPAIAWLREHAGSARVVMTRNLGFLYGIRQASGYDGLSPLRIEQIAGPLGSGNAALSGYVENTAALHGSEPLAPITTLLSPARDLVGQRFILLPPRSDPPGPGLRIAYDGADGRIFENASALPRAFVARRARCVDDRTAIDLVRARAIDLAAEVLLADCSTPRAAATGTGEARIDLDEPERVVVTVTTDGPAWLVLTDTWFPGWRASIDGRPAPVARANHAFRAVAVPGGAHAVEFTFRPRGLATGAAISVTAAVIVSLLLLRRPRVTRDA